MRPRYPVEVVVQDPVRRDDDGRPTLVFLWLASEEDLRRLEADVASGKYNVLNGLEPETLVEDIAMARRKRRRPAESAVEGVAPDATTCVDDYEDVLDDDEEEEPEARAGDDGAPEGAGGDGIAEHQENCPQ